MSSQHPSTDDTPNALQREVVKEELNAILRRYGAADRTRENLYDGVQRFADVLEAITINGVCLPRAELERKAARKFGELFLMARPIPPGSKADARLAETLAVLSEASKQELLKNLAVFTHAIDGLCSEDPSTMESTRVLHWLRLLAIRATCLKGIGSYGAAIVDCTSGLSILDQRYVGSPGPTQVVRMVMSEILACSKLKMGDVEAPFSSAIESCVTLLASNHQSVVTDLANATMASLISKRDEVELTLSLPLGLDRAKRLYEHSPGCIDALSVVLRDLSKRHQYHQVASGCERWVKSFLLRQYLVGLPEKFTPAPGFPVASIFDGPATPYLTVADASITVKSSNSEVLHHYLVALLMQDRWEEAGFVLKHAAGTRLPVESYWMVLRSLEARSEGNHEYKSRRYHDASEAYKKSLHYFTNVCLLSEISRILKGEAQRLLTASFHYKIGKCRMKQLNYDGALKKFRTCLTDVPDFMEALEESASCHWKLKESSQAKKFYQSYISKYKSREDFTYPNVRGVTYPNHVEELAYQRVKEALATLEEHEPTTRRTSAIPPLPSSPPPQPPCQPLDEPSYSSRTQSRYKRLKPDEETASAIDFFGMTASTGTELALNKKYRYATSMRELASKYFVVCEAFEVLHIDPETRSMSAIDEAVRRIGKENARPDIEEAEKTVKTHVACAILELTTPTDLLKIGRTDFNREEKSAFDFLSRVIDADPQNP